MEYLKILGLSITGIIVIACIPTKSKEYNTLLSILICTVILTYLSESISPHISAFYDLIQDPATDLKLFIKITGISIITQFVADIAADSGNKAISNTILMAGKMAIMLLALPLYTQILQIIGQKI